VNETDPWGIAPGVFWVKEELLQHGKYCHYLPDTLCERFLVNIVDRIFWLQIRTLF